MTRDHEPRPPALDGGGVAVIDDAEDDLGQPGALASHLVDLPGSGGRWALWRCAALRGTGFAAERLLEMATPEAAAAADRVLAAEKEAESRCREATDRVNAALDALRAAGRWDDAEVRKPLLKASRKLSKGKGVDGLEPDLQAVVDAFLEAREELERRRREFEERIAGDLVALSRRLAGVAAEPRFREAVVWQNRQAFHTALDKLLQGDAEERNSQRRQHEELVASYLQRYCAKNDSIGFFGPVGWAWWVDDPVGLRVEPGDGLLEERNVFLESWAVEALARSFAERPGMKRWIAPKLVPYVRLEGTALHLPSRQPVRLSPAQAAVVAACDGERTAAEIAARMTDRGQPGLGSERQVLLLLERLQAMELVEWGFRLPVEPRSQRTLRRLLGRVEDEALRRTCLAELEQLERSAAEVARAAGDAERLDGALAAMEELFTRLTDTSATRAAGRTYAGRTLVYEDCRRACDVEVGGDLRRRLGESLTPVLDSVRWYTHRIAELYRREFTRCYRELVREAGSPLVDAHRFWVRIQPLLFEDEERIFNQVQEEFSARWWSILDPPPGERRVELDLDTVCHRVGEIFPAPHPGWRLARYQNPDVMIAAADAAAVTAGDARFVLGEVHVGTNTLNVWVFMAQHPDVGAVARHLERDLPAPRVIPLAPRHWPTLTTRTQMAMVSEKDYYVSTTRGAAVFAQARELPISELVLEEGSDGLRVRSRDRRLSFDVVEFFGDVLSFMANDGFRLVPRRPHLPRISVGGLVLCRESWSFEAGELDFAEGREAADRLLGARRWARRHGLPRFLFAKVPVEKKPFYLDLDSPVYVDLFSKTVRRTLEAEHLGSTVTVSEMLPAPGELWLPDAAGHRYTGELRVLAVDRTG